MYNELVQAKMDSVKAQRKGREGQKTANGRGGAKVENFHRGNQENRAGKCENSNQQSEN